MKSGRIIAVICILIFCGIVPVFSQSVRPRVAVLPFNPIQVSKADAEILTGLFETALVKTAAFDIIEQNRINEILEAQEYSLADCTDEICAVRLGKLLAAEQIILGTCSSIGGRYVLNAKIIDVALGKNLKADKVDADSLAVLADGAEELAFMLSGKQAPGVGSSKATRSSVPGGGTGLAELFIESEPSGAEIYINGERRGTSPELLDRIPVGNVRVEAKKNGLYAIENVKVEISDESVPRLRLRLREQRGNLFIKASDPDARVYLDGRDIGRLDAGFFERQPAGTHTLEIRGNGTYWKGETAIVPDESTRLEVPLREFGEIRYKLPDGTSALISGPGYTGSIVGSGTLEFLDTGVYTATVGGDGLETLNQTIEIKRGSRITFAPEPVHTYDYELSGYRKLLAEIEGYIRTGVGIDRVPGLLERLKRDISNSKFSFDEIGAKIIEFSGEVQSRFSELRNKKFSDDIERYRLGMQEKRTKEREVRDFEKQIGDTEKSREVDPQLIARAKALLNDMKLVAFTNYRDELISEKNRAAGARTGLWNAGWTGMGIGALFGGLAGLSWYLADRSYSPYASAATSEAALTAHRQTAFWDTVTLTTGGAAGVAVLVSAILWAVRPEPESYDPRIAEIDAQIKKFGGSK